MSEPVTKLKTEIRIAHVPDSNPVAFQVVRRSDGKTSLPVSPKSPVGFSVEGRPESDLLKELQWYLETFLDYPFPPEDDHAERVLDSLRDWGQQAFSALFENPSARRIFDTATASNYADLYLQIASDDPQILAWPWEALCDPETGWLAHTCQIERTLNTVRDLPPLPDDLPTDRVNILLVVARPYGKSDVRFRSIARPLVDLIDRGRLPAHVELLRPPTFDQLREHLRENPGFYHILHFDGHGGYGSQEQQSSGYVMKGREGVLVFEKEDGTPDAVSAEKLSLLLKEHALPGVVLNACQSAMGDSTGENPFSSVATALLRSGMRDVVAMAYSLYVSGAQQFLPSFYRRLFETGDMSAAARAGRQQMLQNDKRTSPRGNFPLQDWLLPVLYRQEPISFSFAGESGKAAKPRESGLPESLRSDKDPYGFVGRDSAILDLERAMRRAPAGILIQGLGGSGKTTLARGFLQWLDATSGLGEGCFWLPFQEIRSAEYVFNRLGEPIFGGQFAALPMEQKILALAGVFLEHRFLIVWDNFESAAGIEGTAISANLPESDRKLLAHFLDQLRGGASKVLITSRSTEDWLGPQRRFVLPLGGLDHEERWEYCEVLLRDLGLTVNRNDTNLAGLIDLLGGHPLSMRIILPKLEKMTASQVAADLRSNFAALHIEGDEAQARLNGTLQFVTRSLPVQLQPLLIPLGLHEGYVDADYLEAMARQVDEHWTRVQIDAFTQALVTAGLLRDIGQAIFELHPLLTSYLRSTGPEVPTDRDAWARSFVDVMATLADRLAPLELHQKRFSFHCYGQSFHHALLEAERLEMLTDVSALTQSLASFALYTRNFADAFRLFERRAQLCNRSGDNEGETASFHQLGRVAEEQRDFKAAEQWYLKSLAISEKLGNEHGAANTYHQLGFLAQQQQDFKAAEQWYRKSLAIEEKLGNEHGAAITYHQLGIVAQEQREFKAAEQWYRKSLAIEEKHGKEHGVAISYHQLGMVAQEQRDFKAAEQWYRKSLAIEEKHGNEHGAASTYHQLGIVAQLQQDYKAAEQWYRRSLAIKEKLGNEHGAASTYGQLGIVAGLQGNFSECGTWLAKCIQAFHKMNDPYAAQRNAYNFRLLFDQAPTAGQEKLKAIWNNAGLGEFPEPNQD